MKKLTPIRLFFMSGFLLFMALGFMLMVSSRAQKVFEAMKVAKYGG